MVFYLDPLIDAHKKFFLALYVVICTLVVFLADYYRNAMEKGLKEYAALIDKNYPEQLYQDLAWVGLRGTDSWENMFADPVYTKNEQDRILDTIINFNNSGNNECK